MATVNPAASNVRASPTPLADSVAKSLQFVLLVVLPVAVPLWILTTAWRGNKFAVDFHNVFWPAARLALHGASPYGEGAHLVTPFVYPAPAVWLFAPFGLLPHAAADIGFVAVLIGATFLILRILRVSDWRCYGVAAMWPPVVFALQIANVSLLLALGLAMLWRIRQRPVLASAVVAGLIAIKVFLWPLGVWLIARHGIRRGVLCAIFSSVVVVGGWAALGFRGLIEYPHVLNDLERQWGPTTYSLFALDLRIGLDPTLARALPFVIGGGLLVAASVVQRRGGHEAAPFVMVIVAAVLLSSLVWLHYFALFLVPVAILRPRLSILWLAPLALWAVPDGLYGPSWYPLVLLGASAILVAVASRPQRLPRTPICST